MTGTDSWAIVAATNATADGGSINWAEGQAPSTVNNTARQMLADIRAATNDAAWFQYGTGTQGAGNLAVPAVYSSGTVFTIAGADVTATYHVGRRVRAVGVATGTIYGKISITSYAPTTTTVTAVWDSGSLSNETLVISLSQIPVTGQPVPQQTVVEGTATTVAVTGAFTQLISLALTPGNWRLSATITNNAASGPGGDQCAFSTTTASAAGATFGKSYIQYAVSAAGFGGSAIAPFQITITSNTTYYLNASSTATTPVISAYARAEKI